MNELKERLAHKPSTIAALATLAALLFCVYIRPELIDDAGKLVLLGGVFFGLFYKGSKSEE